MIEDKNIYGTVELLNKTNNRLVLEDVGIELSRQNNIVETVVVGNERTVKEEVSVQDWVIDLKIGLRNEDENDITAYPYERVKAVLNFMVKGSRMDIYNKTLKMLDIDAVVIKNISLSPTPHSNYQMINVSCVSDSDFEMVIEE